MSGIEQRLRNTLAEPLVHDERPDLFARVQLSIADDRRLRAQRRALAVIWPALAGAVVAVVAATAAWRALPDRPNEPRRLLMDWWILELITDAILIGVACWLGPFIKRFGRSYAADVFRANPRTGKSFLALTDVAYYLIFLAFIMFTARFEPERSWDDVVVAAQIKESTARVGGILLIIGVLHGANLLLLPLVGRVLTLNRRLDDTVPPSRSDEPLA